ncbi:hypothetical protein CEH05_20150 [Halobacillus halophilus]|uniref:hypothetical protein n=1 Tax=Halobacillus halophilus TaxID=1570 RepID=UPI0005A1038C|nr:hypothetical protein [Halobacillus halophilus]ASF41353.1 hypothetical protein CEH05_20150 [Halobacillus halophilus]
MRIKTILFVLLILALLPGCTSEVRLYDYDRSLVVEKSDKLPEDALLPKQLPFKVTDIQVSNEMAAGQITAISFQNKHNSVVSLLISEVGWNPGVSYESEPIKISDEWMGEYILEDDGHTILWKDENLSYRFNYVSFSNEDDLSREQVLQVIRQFEPLP